MKYLYLLIFIVATTVGIGLAHAQLAQHPPSRQLVSIPYISPQSDVMQEGTQAQRDSIMAPALHPAVADKASRSGQMVFQSGKLLYEMGHAAIQTFLRIYGRGL